MADTPTKTSMPATTSDAHTRTSMPATSAPPRIAARPKRSIWRRASQNIRTWARQTFARDQMIASLKSLAWVVPMTLLIWIYAERQQTAHQTVSFRIDVRNTDPNRVIDVPDDRVSAELSGPQARLEQVREKLESVDGARQVQADFNLPAGRSQIDLSSLSNDALFEKNGLTVSNISPKRLTVIIDPIERRSVDVQAAASTIQLDSPAVFDPPAVQVSGPRSVLDAAEAQGKLTVYASLGDLREPGFKELHNLPLTLAYRDPRLSVSPSTVSARVNVKKSEVEATIRSMPVWALYPPTATWDKYKASYDQTVTDVKVTGPAEMIQKVNQPDFENPPKAVFDVTTANPSIGLNPAGTEHEAELHFDFGKTGLKISPDEHRKITFTIIERKLPE